MSSYGSLHSLPLVRSVHLLVYVSAGSDLVIFDLYDSVGGVLAVNMIRFVKLVL